MKFSTELAIFSVLAVGGYLLIKKTLASVPTAVDITDPRNIANTATEKFYKAITGSTQGPAADYADYVNKNADATTLQTLVDFFKKQGISDSTKASALKIGWTQVDVDRAVNLATPDLDSTKYIYELPPQI